MSAALCGSERVLVRLPSWLGDFVMAEPLVRALDEHLTQGELTLAARREHLELLTGRFPRVRRKAFASAARAEYRHWTGHDVALLCTGSFRSAWGTLRAGIPRRIGFARDGRGLLLTDALSPARECGATPLELGTHGRGRRYLPRPLERSLTELLGIVGVTVRDPRPWLEIREPWLLNARARRVRLGLTPDEPYLLANVGARVGSAKGFPPEQWRHVLADLGRRSALPILLLGGPGEEPTLAAVCAGLHGLHPLVAPPADLTELAAQCSEAELVLTADSGPRHVARAVAAAVVTMAGPTDPRHAAGERAREVLLRSCVPCGPCHRELCPRGGAEHQRCMTVIDSERIVAAALGLIRQDPPVTMA